MGNLGTREKYGMIALVVVIILFFIYLLGIRTLNNDYQNQINQLNELQARVDYLDALKENNDAARVEIAQVRSNIISEEDRFIPQIHTEVLEQYVTKKFEDNGCPYLVSLNSADISFPVVVLPDGSTSEDSLVCKRISVTYSTTDGFNIPQYNRTNSIIEDGIPNYETLETLIEMMETRTGPWNEEGAIGYDEFINALKDIESEDPDAIKLYSISAVDSGGHMLLTAEIDFYSVTFLNRISTNSSNAPYAAWAGDTNISTDAGFIGMPYIVTDENSAWYHVMIPQISEDMPFATYYSSSVFNSLIAANENGLPGVLGLVGDDVVGGVTNGATTETELVFD
ncbi:MAG: hypothetical protein J5685_11580 [Clostridiales bacterium]|nr:hypothetical protein [Clostridiales bacterium]